MAPTGKREAHELLLIEEADAWFEYADATKGQAGQRYADNLLAFLDADFVIKRFRELSFDKLAYWRESAIPMPELEKWMEKEREKIDSHTSQLVVEGAVALGDGLQPAALRAFRPCAGAAEVS